MMGLFKRAVATGIMGLGLCAFSAPQAEAGSFYFGLGNGGYYGSGYGNYGGHGNHHGYGGYGQGRSYHNTGHYDYHQPSIQRHYNHYDYVPGHYDYHNTGHWDRNRGYGYGGHHGH